MYNWYPGVCYILVLVLEFKVGNDSQARFLPSSLFRPRPNPSSPDDSRYLVALLYARKHIIYEYDIAGCAKVGV